MEPIDDLLSSLESNTSDEAVQETLGEIKKNLIQFASSSRSVLNSARFLEKANS